MSSRDYEKLLNCQGKEFFQSLEEILKTAISDYLKNILQLNGLDNAVRFMKFEDSCITEIEDFMKNYFDIAMVDNDNAQDYLGAFLNCQQKFKLLSGHKIFLNIIKETCQNAQQQQQQQRHCSNQQQSSSVTFVEADSEKLDTNNYDSLYKKIGAQMITVFNDAKKITLSAWSWPARNVAYMLSAEYEEKGYCEGNINFQYLNPGHHKDLLDSIVKSDFPNLRSRIENALAISLRVDGSNDRTQDHNVFVLASLVYFDGSTETTFLGFKVPKIVKPPALPSEAYFQAVKDTVTDILPWETLFSNTTSIVTDGESINTGDLNGLCIRLLRERLNSADFLKPLISIWCVAHRTNLAWKSICEQISLISNVITDASNLSSYFHRSGQRTQKLKDISLENTEQYQQFIRYPTHFEVRWTQFTYSLFTAVLRNWKASIAYFKNENESGLLNVWLNFDRIYLITFLTDILGLYQSFQKTFEFDSISVLDIKSKKNELVTKYIKMKTEPLEEGWEELFLRNTVSPENENEILFLGHTLIRKNIKTRVSQPINREVYRAVNQIVNPRGNRRIQRVGNRGINRGGTRGVNRGVIRGVSRGIACKVNRGVNRRIHKGINRGSNTFNSSQRIKILNLLIKFLNDRLDTDLEIYQQLEPLFKIDLSTSDDSLKTCYSKIIPDLDEQSFYSEYRMAAELLASEECKGPLANIKKLVSISEDQFTVLKAALARIVAAKPHSADVERLINKYNKFKDNDRCSTSPSILFNNLYVNMNMGPLEKFDPSSAAKHWMNLKARRPRPNSKSKEQEWFIGVFQDASEKIRNGPRKPKIMF